MDQLETDPFRLAGFTWAGGPSEAAIQIRTRTMATGGWSPWSTLHDDGHGPDPGTAAAGQARRGTALLIVAESDAVEVRIDSPDGNIPQDLQLSLIEPGSSDADVDAGATAAQTGVPQPTIRTRADWGADESIMTWDPEYGEVRGMFVHHTAGGNSYTETQVPGIIRGIYVYQAVELGWGDIGYNFLLDKFGRIWEGRYGGIAEALIGGHTLGYNTYSFGAAVLGNYVAKEPEPVVLQAFEELIAWKFLLHGVDPNATVAYPGKNTLQTISGHRNGYPTACPGDLLYAQLGTIRDGVRQIMDETSVASELTLLAHTTAVRAGKKIWFDISWRAGATGVTGTVDLQRRSGDSWVRVRSATVTDGVGAIQASPPGDRIYRLRSLSATQPLNVTPVVSGEVPIEAVQSDGDLTMSRAGATSPDGEVPIAIDWLWAGHGVTGQVAVQYYRDGRWRHARYATVTNGTGATVLRPSRTQVYRLRAASASSPAGVDLTHPGGTSNEFRVVVR